MLFDAVSTVALSDEWQRFVISCLVLCSLLSFLPLKDDGAFLAEVLAHAGVDFEQQAIPRQLDELARELHRRLHRETSPALFAELLHLSMLLMPRM